MPIYVEKIKDKTTGKIIEKKVDGKKQYYIRTYIEDEFGNRKQITRHNKNWLGRAGYDLAHQEEGRLKNQVLIEEEKNKHITLHELKELYLKSCLNSVDPDTIKAKNTKLSHFCDIDDTHQVKTFPNKTLSTVTKDLYIEWKNQMRKKTYKRRNNKTFYYSLQRLNAIHNEIVSMFDFAILNGYTAKNIPKQVGKFGTSKEIKLSQHKKKYQTITYDEYNRLMSVTKDNLKYNTIFDLMFSRGPRVGEIRAFKIKDYNYEKKQLMVNHTLSKKNELKEPKTASSKNTIDLDDKLNEKIHQLVKIAKENNDFNEEWFLFGNKNMPISSNAINHSKIKYFKLANINKNIRLHDFRHSCATWLFSIGIPITVISRILRHQDISTTMKTYTHLLENDYQNALLKLENLKNKTKHNNT